MGGPNELGTTVNIPLPPMTGEEGFLYTLNELVMPLLEDFQPELIINSAGQDNHFNDPITNMNFSAHGYAALNEILRPDIAVLEGGYAVENALPYVNVGIIMAMMGLDTSCVKEPNYDRDYMPQPPEITEHIQQLISQLKDYFLGGGLKEKALPERGRTVERERDIFYDTDGIHERQKEIIITCDQCAGALAIETLSSLGNHAMAVRIPAAACPSCEKTGRAWFEDARTRFFDQVYLMDRKNGRFESV
jgi:hypothetical protein